MSNRYSKDPSDPKAFTQKFDRFYTRTAKTYSWFIRLVPIWRNWIEKALPYLKGPRVLEVSFGTGHLITRAGMRFETYGMDLNKRFTLLVKDKLAEQAIPANIQQADVSHLPYRSGSFHSVVNTTALSGYPNAQTAMEEMIRVLAPGGRLIIIDINYPNDGNLIGTWITRGFMYGGDLIRDLHTLLDSFPVEWKDLEIGGFGSVHLYYAEKQLNL